MYLKNIAFLFLALSLASACRKTTISPNTTLPVVEEADSISFAVIGDYGEAGEPARRVAALIESWQADFIITLGDNNYANGALETIPENIIQYYEDYIYNPSAPAGYQCRGKAYTEQKNRFFPTIGNHDYHPQEEYLPYLSFFCLPDKESYYEFEWGPIHFFTINSGKDGEATCCDSEQTQWLQDRLKKSRRKFQILYFHYPPYSTSHHGSNPNLQWNFSSWGVDAVMSGHEHVYQRIIRKADPELPYFVNGLGGRESRYDCHSHPLPTTDFDAYCYNDQHGAMRVTATYDRIIFEFYAVDQPDTPIDRWVVE